MSEHGIFAPLLFSIVLGLVLHMSPGGMGGMGGGVPITPGFFPLDDDVDGIGIADEDGMGIPPPQHPLLPFAEPIGIGGFPPMPDDDLGIGFPPMLEDALGIGMAVAVGPPPVGITIALSDAIELPIDALAGGITTCRFGSTSDGGRLSGAVASLLGAGMFMSLPPSRQLAAISPTEEATKIEKRARFMGDIRFRC